MNKTVNINLAGIFFHIDEDAYLKLQRYLEAIKRSFTDSQGRSEIIADIEARIAELFSERIENHKQVIGVSQVDEIISIMGQPEDYLVDDEIFEDEPQSSYQKTNHTRTSKRLYRDTENSYVGGVSSGLAHYFGIDAIWIRLIWVLLIFGAGTGVLLYILLWILVPEAQTTAEKIMMTGEPVNISNIEKKIKDGFESVSNSVKNVDLKKHGDRLKEGFEHVSDSISDSVRSVNFDQQGRRIKSSSKTFFDAIGEILMIFVKAVAKLIGIMLIIFGAVMLFALIVSLFSIGSSSMLSPWWMDYPTALNITGIPFWLGGLILFFFFGIPLFFIAYLGLKLLITNLKSIGKVAKFSLLGIWLISIFSIIFISASQASYFSLENSTEETETLAGISSDTLSVKMNMSDLNRRNNGSYRNNGFEITYDKRDQKVIFSRNIRLDVRSTKDSVASIKIIKEAKGRDFMQARETAENINYGYELKNNQLLLDNFLTTDYENKFLDQNVKVVLFLPEGSYVRLNSNVKSFLSYHSSSRNIASYNSANHLLLVKEDKVECLDCEDEEASDVNEDDSDSEEETSDSLKIKLDDDGLEINGTEVNDSIESINVKIDGDGIEVKANDPGNNL